MLLIIEVAVGVLLALLLYRDLVSFSKETELTIPAIIWTISSLLFGLVVVIGILGVAAIALCYFYLDPQTFRHSLRGHTSELGWAAGVFVVLSFGYAVYSDVRKRGRKKQREGLENDSKIVT